MYFGKTLIGLVVGLFSLNTGFAQPLPDYKYLYNYAEKLSNAENHTDKTDELALKTYIKVIDILTKTKMDDLFLLKAYINTGSFLQVLSRQKEAVNYFKR